MDIIALVLLGTLTGNELAVGGFVHPALSRLPDEQHAASARALARIYGKVGPVWYAAAIICLIVAAVRTTPKSSGKALRIVSSVIVAASIILTVARLVPINNRVAAWDLSNLPPDWKSERSKWDKFHAVRILMLLASFSAFATGATRK